MNGRVTRVFLVTLFIFIAFAAVVLAGVSAGGGTVAGPWRDINPTQYLSAGDAGVPGPNVAFNGIYVRTSGFGSVGAGDAWAVGGCNTAAGWPFSATGCGGSGGGTIAWYDGFSWNIKGNPYGAGTAYTGVNFCTSPGAPGVGLCSPNGDGTDGWIVGGNSTGMVAIYVTNPSSLSPDSANLPLSGYLTSVFETCHVTNDPNGVGCPSGLNAGAAYAAGTAGGHGVIFEYSGPAPTNGGWTLVYTSSTATIYNSIYMYVDSSNQLGGFAVGDNGVVARLSTGSWVDTVVTPTTTFHGVAVDNGNPIDAWAVGFDSVAAGGVIYHFSSGSWAGPLSPSPVASVTLESVFLVSQSEGWIVGTESTILHGTNLPGSNFDAISTAGSNPLFSATGIGIDLNSVSFQSGGAGWAVGTHGVILQTSDSSCDSIVQASGNMACWGGQTSIVQTTQLNAVYEVGSSDAWAGGLYDTVNLMPSIIHWDGDKWHRANVASGIGTITKPDIYGIFMAGGGEGYAVGGQLASTGATCLVTNCPGAYTWNTIVSNTWQPVKVTQCANAAGCLMKSVYFASINGIDGWAVGTNGGVWTYDKQSPQWVASATGLPPGFSTNLNAVFINNPGNNNPAGWAVGDGGTVLSLDCNSAPCLWNQASIQGLSGAVNLYGIYFTDSQHGWIVGSGNTIISTIDGLNWVVGSAANALPTTTWTSVHVDSYGTTAGSGDGWAVGCSVALTTANPTCAGNEATAWFNGGGWTFMNLPTPVYPGLGLYSVFTTSPTDGWAVGAPSSAGTNGLSGIFHLDPVNPPIYGAGAGTTTITSTSGSSTVTTTSTSATTTTTSTSTSLITESTTSTSSSLSTSTLTSTSTETSTVFSSNTQQIPGIPAFPWESILAGIFVGLVAVGIIRRTKK